MSPFPSPNAASDPKSIQQLVLICTHSVLYHWRIMILTFISLLISQLDRQWWIFLWIV